ncbi:MAG: phosphotransferase, partial [Isosphaeraceae bacterium]|nr:phosphotransferase [Isosphaeraceae bacterium]
LEEIQRLQKRAERLGFVPVPLQTLDGSTLIESAGRYWELSPWMPGTADLQRPPAPARLRAGFAGLAAFHQALAEGARIARPANLAARLREIETLRTVHLRSWRLIVDRAAPDPRRELARRWLDLAGALAPWVYEGAARVAAREVPIQPCLRDVRPDHLLFEGDRLTGLVDFGAMGPDSVAADLARLLAEWVGPHRAARAEALAAYAAIRPLDESETALISAYERTAALLGGGRWLRWHFLEGRTFDDPSAVLRGLERGVERLAELAAEVAGRA